MKAYSNFIIRCAVLPLCATAGIAGAAEPLVPPASFSPLDQEVQALKKDVMTLNRDLFVLEEELLFPANTQVAIFVSMDVGTFFGLDSVQVKLNDKVVANYLYTEREAKALFKGGVQRIYIGNLRAGKNELIAYFTGTGPHNRDYTRATSFEFNKGLSPKFLELRINDKQAKLQPEFAVKEWE